MIVQIVALFVGSQFGNHNKEHMVSFGSKICEMKRSKIHNIIQFIVKHTEF